MARGRSVSSFTHFGNGLNTADGVFGLREGNAGGSQVGSECRRCLNVVSKHRGNISRRSGCTEVLTGGVASAFKDFSVIGNGSSSFAVASTDDGSLIAVSSVFGRTTLAAAATVSTTAPWVFMRMPTNGGQGPAYGMNGTNTPRYTDGTAIGSWTASSGSLPNGTLMEYWENTLWVSGVAGATETLYWSGIGNPRDWPAANVTKFAPDDGLPITALRALGGYLLVFKERGIWRVYDSETSADVKFTEGVGTLSPNSVVAAPQGVFFLDPALGVHLTDGTNVRRISTQIQPLLDEIVDSDLADVSGAYHDGHYYLSVKVNGTQEILDYNVELDSWWVHTPQIKRLAIWDTGADANLLGVVTGTASLWQMFVEGATQDAGAIFESYWSGPFHAFGAPHLRKRLNEVHVDARGIVDIYVAADYDLAVGSREDSIDFSAQDLGGGTFGSGGTFGGLVGTFGGGGAVGEGWVYSLGVARSWSLTFYSAADQFWEVDAYTMGVTSRRD